MEVGGYPLDSFSTFQTHCKLFVGGLHVDTDNESLRAYFEQFGEILDAVVMRDGATRKSRGFGFITFADINNATICMKDTHTVDGKEVGVDSK